jgi:hypothetical protein
MPLRRRSPLADPEPLTWPLTGPVGPEDQEQDPLVPGLPLLTERNARTRGEEVLPLLDVALLVLVAIVFAAAVVLVLVMTE